MQNISSFFDTKKAGGMVMAVVLSFFLVALITYGATTISTNINSGGTLDVTGASTLTNLTATASSTFNTTLTVTGASTFTGIGKFSDAVRASSTVDVTGAFRTYGATTLGDTGADNIIITGNASTTNSFQVGSELYAIGSSTLSSTLTVGGASTFTGIGKFSDALRASSTVDVTGAFRTYGATTLGDTGADNIIITGNASTTNSFQVGSELYAIGSSTLSSTLTVGGVSTFTGNITAKGSLTVNGTFTPAIASSTNLSVTSQFDAGGTATTTISSAGNLSVGGRATTTASSGNFATVGAISASSTMDVTGAFRTYGATTLGDTGADNIIITGNASTTNSFQVGSELYAIGSSTLSGTLDVGGVATFTSAPVFNAGATAGDANGDTFTVRAGAMNFTSTATTTSAITTGLNFDSNTFVIDGNSSAVGIGTSTPNITGMIFGTCTITGATVTATTTRGFPCVNAEGITTSYKAFVQATSSISSVWGGFMAVAASSTAANTIGVSVYNQTGGDANPGNFTLNFYGIK